MIVVARQHFDHARADLGRTDERAEGDRKGEVQAARLQQRQQVGADNREDRGADRDHRGEDPNTRLLARRSRGSRLRLRRIRRVFPAAAPASRSAATSRSGSPHRPGTPRAIRAAAPDRRSAASTPCWQSRRTTSPRCRPRARSIHRCFRASRTPHRTARRPSRRRRSPRPRIQRRFGARPSPARPTASSTAPAASTGRPPWLEMKCADARRHQPGDEQADRGAGITQSYRQPVSRATRARARRAVERRAPRQNLRDAKGGDDEAPVGEVSVTRFPLSDQNDKQGRLRGPAAIGTDAITPRRPDRQARRAGRRSSRTPDRRRRPAGARSRKPRARPGWT